MNLDIYLVGVGGQGILTIGELLASTAERAAMPVVFFPSKGMAQRGGFVKAQLRLGRASASPNIPERSADLVFAMEQSEALKAIRYVKPGGDFVLYADIWAPTAVMLGKAPYPEIAQVRTAVGEARARLIDIPRECLPMVEGEPAAPNCFLLGIALAQTLLGRLFTPPQLEQSIQKHWPHGKQSNLQAFRAGLAFQLEIPASGQKDRLA